MSRAFVSQLRRRPVALRLGPVEVGAEAIGVRVEMPEVWDAVLIEAPESAPVADLKRLALEALDPSARFPADYVMKLNGFEVLDERASLTEAGALDGSTFLLTYRRRRPVR